MMSPPRQRAWTAMVILCAAALLLFGGVSFARRVAAQRPGLAVVWQDDGSGLPLARQVEPFGPAARAGLRPGDRLVAANGRAVRSALEANDLEWSVPADSPLRLSIDRPGEAALLGVAWTPAWRPSHEPYPYLALVGLAFWASGLLIAVRWPRLRAGPPYIGLSASLFAGLVCSSTGVGDRLDWAIEAVDLLALAFAPALLMHTVIAFARRALPLRRASVLMCYGVGGLVALWAVWLSPIGLHGAARSTDPVGALETWDRSAMGLWIAAVVAAIALLAKSYRQSPSVLHRSQVRWMLRGLVAGTGPFVLLHALPWVLQGRAAPAWLQFVAVAPLMLVPAAFTAALVRYRLHDLDLLVVRGMSEIGAVFCTFGVLASVVFLLREGLGEWFDLSQSATRYIGFLSAALAYPQLRTATRVGVEKAFYRKRYSYRTTLLDWARELNAETDLASLVANLRARVRDTLGVGRAEILLASSDETYWHTAESPDLHLSLDETHRAVLANESCVVLDDHGLMDLSWARYLFPLRVKGRLRAVLAVCERDSALEPLTSEDRELLATLAAHAGTAIEAARLVLEVRRRAEEIEHLLDRQARILESSAVGLLLLDAEGRIQAWNRALEELYGQTRAEVLGRHLAEVFPLHVVRRVERLTELPQAEEGRLFSVTIVNRLDQRRVVNVAITRTDDGGRVVTFDDITNRVKLEAQVVRQERLAALGLLAAGVAHEINTPLTGISSYTQMLQEDGAVDPSRRELLDKIEAQARRASTIANSLLNMARPERTSFEALDLNETIQEVLQLFAPQVRHGAVELTARLEQELPAVRGHKGKLQQVLLNLLSNARDAVGGSGQVRVTTSHRNGTVMVEVADDGAGIHEDDLPRIFDPFFTTKGRGKGTGLGLSITYGIVQEHEGQIHVESAPGELTRFRVELPAARTARALA